ncbi:tyrosine-type recombinase/integrase [Nonomuraea thailandensis]|uniref:tyrosine-type recombinase/integrase n=1 Tax=Nonomuraea thailandensis TaxID=1188745 RepID=UPI0023E2E5D4
MLFSTGLRRAELVGLNLDQLQPANPDRLRQAGRARLCGVHHQARTRRAGGAGRTARPGRIVFLGRDTRHALADYLQTERPGDATASTQPAAIFLAASTIGSRRPDGRLSARAINTIVGELARLHDAQTTDPDHKLGHLRPHDARHTFAFTLARATGHDRAELKRRLGPASKRYLRLYTGPPDDNAADYVEDL